MTISPITLREAAERHGKELQRLSDLAGGSIRNYLSAYNTLGRYLESTLGREALTTDLTADAIAGYFSDYVAVNASATFAQRRSNLSSIADWLMHKRYMEWGPNPTASLPKRRQTTRGRDRWLSDAEVLRLLKAAKASHDRDYYLVLFLRLTGRRIGEVIGGRDDQKPLLWADIRWDEGFVEWANFKGRKLSNTLPLTPRLRAVLEAWRESYCRELGVDEPHPSWIIFPALTPIGPARRGRTRRRVVAPKSRMTNANKVAGALLKASDLWRESGESWHLLRKAFAAQRKRAADAQNRGDAWDLTKIALDHEEVTTTRIYVPINEEYERYSAWAMETPELSSEGMAKIPELASFATEAVQEKTKEPAFAGSDDTTEGYRVSTSDGSLGDVVNFAAFAERRRALA